LAETKKGPSLGGPTAAAGPISHFLRQERGVPAPAVKALELDSDVLGYLSSGKKLVGAGAAFPLEQTSIDPTGEKKVPGGVDREKDWVLRATTKDREIWLPRRGGGQLEALLSRDRELGSRFIRGGNGMDV